MRYFMRNYGRYLNIDTYSSIRCHLLVFIHIRLNLLPTIYPNIYSSAKYSITKVE